MASETTVNLKSFLSSVRLKSDAPEIASPQPMLSANLEKVVDDVSPEARFISSMAAVVHNMKPGENRFDKQSIQELVKDIDLLVDAQINEILHAPEFQDVESPWTAIADLVKETNFRANISLSLLDLNKEEAYEDLELNAADVAGSEIFKKVYVAEYDQFGGLPFGGMIGLYDFGNTKSDILWLRTIGKIAAASHAPFVASASPQLFHCKTMNEVNQLRDIGGLFNTPAYAAWNKFRDSEEAVYVGLTMPRYLVRSPYHPMNNPADGISFTESVRGDNEAEYLWGSTAVLFARCMVKSFESSGWCQYLRGVKGGGLVTGLSSHTFNIRGENELRAPVETSMPDYRELELANAGLIPLIHKKGTADAVFFSAQATKLTHRFKDTKDSENSQLVANLSYTYSVSRIAHYIKCIMRDNIGSSADGGYIKAQIEGWIQRYITTAQNPDDLTLRYYPFKAYKLDIAPVDGKIGWYHCNLAILPHIQFEGMDVDLRVDARLG